MIALAAVMIFHQPTFADILTLDFIVDTLFFGAIHVYLTFCLLLLPATSIWLNERKKAGRHSVALMSIVIMACLFSFVLWRGLTFGQNTALRLNIIAVTTFLFSVLGLHYSIWQVKGLSFTIQHDSKIEPNEILRARGFFRSDHQAFGVLLALALVMPMLHGTTRLFPMFTSDINFRMVAVTTSIAMLVVIGALVAPLFRSPSKSDVVRGWYLLRLSAWALTPLSRYGFLATGAIHGIEYFFVILQLFKGESRRLLIGSTVALLSVAVFLRIAATKFTADPANASLVLVVLNAIALTIGATHYYWDRVLFAMRDPETRAFTGKRLLTEKVNT